MNFIQLVYKKSGIIASAIFIFMIILIGAITPDYSHSSQYISELGATGATYSNIMNWFGIIPFGGMIIVFAILFSSREQNLLLKLIGGGLIGACGVGFIIAGYYQCDQGCSFENMSSSQVIHNIAAMLAFLIAIIASLIIGLVRWKRMWRKDGIYGVFNGVLLSGLAMIGALYGMMLIGHESEYIGLMQRGFIIGLCSWLITTNLTLENADN